MYCTAENLQMWQFGLIVFALSHLFRRSLLSNKTAPFIKTRCLLTAACPQRKLNYRKRCLSAHQGNFFTSLSLSSLSPSLKHTISSPSPFLPDYYYLLLVQKLHAIIWKATFLIIKLHQRKNSPTTKESKALLKRFPFLLFYCQNLPFNCSRKKNELIESKRANQS